MFGKSNDGSTDTNSVESARPTVSTVAVNMSLTGELDGEGDVNLEGSFNGTLRCRQLVVSETGSFEGTVTAQEVTVSGTINGDIEAKIVRLRATAVVNGNVRHEVLEVEAGAKVEGRYTRETQKAVVKPKSGLQSSDPPRAPKGSKEAAGTINAKSKASSSKPETKQPPAS